MADLLPETRDAVREGCKRSAATVLPLVLDYLGGVDAILDVGAGEGWWSLAAHELGCETFAVDLAAHDSPPCHVYGWDAERSDALPLRGGAWSEQAANGDRFGGGKWSRWPLALCLEMAEHVSPAAGDHLVSELCRVSEAVLWSAAIPGQGGDGHVNEQWPDYWHARFMENGWRLTDPLRDDLWMHPDVDPWYRSNTLLAVPIPLNPRGMIVTVAPHPLVDPATWAHHRGVPAPSA